MNYEQMMAELQTEYIASMPDKIAVIEKHLQDNDREQLRDDFHKLKGTGKTYGIPEISLLAEVIEKLCLKKETPTKEFIPSAVNFLQNIYELRKNKQPLDIGSEQNFIKLQKMLSQ